MPLPEALSRPVAPGFTFAGASTAATFSSLAARAEGSENDARSTATQTETAEAIRGRKGSFIAGASYRISRQMSERCERDVKGASTGHSEAAVRSRQGAKAQSGLRKPCAKLR